MSQWIEQFSIQPSPDPIEIFVVKENGGWRIKVGEITTQPRATETEAIWEAMSGARELGKAGIESRVVMSLLTCAFSQHGIGRTFPTAGQRWTKSPGELRLLSPL